MKKARDREQQRIYNRAYRASHREERAAYGKAYRAGNVELIRARIEARKLAKKAANGPRIRQCRECGQNFTYEVKRGSDRALCSSACRVASRNRRQKEREANAGPCATVGCDKRSRPNSKDGLCEACYAYAWRTGKARDPKKKPYKLTTVRRSEGKSYRVLMVPGHPLAMSGGNVYHHRLVAYSARDGVCGCCHWCSKPLDWSTAIVDHLNENGQDNSPANLVVTCNKCNRSRGAMLPFFRSLNPERFDQLAELMRNQLKCTAGGVVECSSLKAG